MFERRGKGHFNISGKGAHCRSVFPTLFPEPRLICPRVRLVSVW